MNEKNLENLELSNMADDQRLLTANNFIWKKKFVISLTFAKNAIFETYLSWKVIKQSESEQAIIIIILLFQAYEFCQF